LEVGCLPGQSVSIFEGVTYLGSSGSVAVFEREFDVRLFRSSGNDKTANRIH
jgi:hypothetical protein